ncbi:hypothetical protein [Candidatus Hadarchaeum sp.]
MQLDYPDVADHMVRSMTKTHIITTPSCRELNEDVEIACSKSL